jgi:hypothetical protein
MPPGERLFRALWLGPFGRAFIRFGSRAVKMRVATSRSLPSVRSATLTPVVALQAPSAGSVATPIDTITALERRVSALESWRNGGVGVGEGR